MKISQKGLYALQAMMMLARHHNQGAIRIRDIAYEEVLPEKFLELILLELKNARLVESVRGAKGGYQLRRSPADIHLSEIIRLIEVAVMAGEARATDPRVSALSIIGMAMWTAWWFQPEHGRSLETVAEEIADNAAAVIQRAAPAKQIATVAELTGEIRENLALIDRLAERAKR